MLLQTTVMERLLNQMMMRKLRFLLLNHPLTIHHPDILKVQTGRYTKCTETTSNRMMVHIYQGVSGKIRHGNNVGGRLLAYQFSIIQSPKVK